MVSKIQQCIEHLNLLSDPCTPTSRQVRKIAEKIGCNEITGWRALKRIRAQRGYVSYFHMVEDYKACIEVLYTILRDKMTPKDKLSFKEKKVIEKVMRILGIKREKEGVNNDHL